MFPRLPIVVATLCLLLAAGPAIAETHPGKSGKPGEEGGGPGVLSLLPPASKTDHSIIVGGHTLAYEAEAGTLPLIGGDGKTIARMFYVAYDLKQTGDAKPSAERPVTFVFNGGPGAASAYLQLGALGPRVLRTSPDGAFLPPPQKLADNPDTWLGMSDLVFVDPVGTGYSRAAPGQKDSEFWGVKQDASAMTAFIRLYLQHAGRTDAPVWLAGESYGGFRAALLAKTLQEDAGISPTGIVLISPALEFSFVYGGDYRPLNWALTLPSMAAVHLEDNGIQGADLAQKLAGIEDYAMGDYLVALASGLESGGRQASRKVAEATGLPMDFVRQNHARITASAFARQYDKARGLELSLYDGTISTADLAPGSPRDRTPDPVLDRSIPVVTSAFVHYVRQDLNYRTDVSYRLLDREISHKWDYGGGKSSQGYAGVLDDLQEARSLNPALKVMIVNGYTDLVTPFMTSRYLVGQLPKLPGAEPIRVDTYPGGHMMYLRPDSRHRLKEDAASLYQNPS